MNNEFKKIQRLVNDAKRVGFITHQDGDGDAFGSMMALKRVIKDMGKKVFVFSNEEWPQIAEFLKEKITYKPKEKWEDIDLLIGFDANTKDRFVIPGIFDEAKKKGTKIVILDHHEKGDIGKLADIYLWETKISSTSELVFNLIVTMKKNIDKITATLLLLGIETDTFSLQFTNTTPETFIAVSELLKKGARLKPIVENAFGGRPIPTIKIMGRAINRLEVDKKSGIAITFIRHSDIKELELSEQSSSGVANFIDQIDGVKVVVVVEEREPHLIKVSLRSNNSNIDVARFANKYGGGGHKKAAGFKIEGKFEEVFRDIKQKLLTL